MPEPARARAVLSTEDFRLIQEAVLFWLRANEDSEDSSKFSVPGEELRPAVRYPCAAGRLRFSAAHRGGTGARHARSAPRSVRGSAARPRP